MQRVLVISYRSFCILLDSWTLRMGPICCPEKSVRTDNDSLRNNAEEHCSQSPSFLTTWLRNFRIHLIFCCIGGTIWLFWNHLILCTKLVKIFNKTFVRYDILSIDIRINFAGFLRCCTVHVHSISYLLSNWLHTNYYKIVELLKSFKIVAPTCFGLHKPSSGSSQPVLRQPQY